MNFQPLKDFLDYYLPVLGVPGSDTIIYRGHEEVFRYQSGFDSLRMRTAVRPDALYWMYSCSKISTCIAATQLIERGEILATDPVYAYFPEYKDMSVKVTGADGSVSIVPAKRPMLIGQLLSMTSGMNYELQRPAIARVQQQTGGRAPTLDIVRALAEEPLEFEPGTEYRYSLSLDVIGGLVELVSGMPLSQYMKENIFDPLGMRDTSFHLTPESRARLATQYTYDEKNRVAVETEIDANEFIFGTEYESGGAGLISSVEDQILIADALTHLGVGKSGNRILSEYGVNLMRTNMLTPQIRQDTYQMPYVLGYGYGYGVRMSVAPGMAGNLMPAGEFEWDGRRLSYLSACPETGISIFHAEHMGGLHSVVIPRLRNVIYSCMEK